MTIGWQVSVSVWVCAIRNVKKNYVWFQWASYIGMLDYCTWCEISEIFYSFFFCCLVSILNGNATDNALNLGFECLIECILFPTKNPKLFYYCICLSNTNSSFISYTLETVSHWMLTDRQWFVRIFCNMQYQFFNSFCSFGSFGLFEHMQCILHSAAIHLNQHSGP